MNRWTLQMGFPVVTVDTGTGTVSQKHFLLDPQSVVDRPSQFKWESLEPQGPGPAFLIRGIKGPFGWFTLCPLCPLSSSSSVCPQLRVVCPNKVDEVRRGADAILAPTGDG